MNRWRQAYHVLVHGIKARHSVLEGGYETIEHWCACGQLVGRERRKVPTS